MPECKELGIYANVFTHREYRCCYCYFFFLKKTRPSWYHSWYIHQICPKGGIVGVTIQHHCSSFPIQNVFPGTQQIICFHFRCFSFTLKTFLLLKKKMRVFVATPWRGLYLERKKEVCILMSSSHASLW